MWARLVLNFIAKQSMYLYELVIMRDNDANFKPVNLVTTTAKIDKYVCCAEPIAKRNNAPQENIEVTRTKYTTA